MNKIIDLGKYSHYKSVKTVDEQYLCVNPNDIYIGNQDCTIYDNNCCNTKNLWIWLW
jgi:hypothetical protein